MARWAITVEETITTTVEVSDEGMTLEEAQQAALKHPLNGPAVLNVRYTERRCVMHDLLEADEPPTKK